MKYYAAIATVHSPLIFTSYIVGSSKTGYLFATSPYIHNYPLLYALNERPAEAAYIVTSKHLSKDRPLEYRLARQVVEALARGERPPAPYPYPLQPLRVDYVTIHTTMLTDQYYFDIRAKPKTIAPRNQNYVAIKPGSRFYSLILSPTPLPSRVYVSIGVKRLGILRVDLYEMEPVERLEGEAVSTVLVNEGDARLFGYEGVYTLVFETRTRPSWNPRASRIAMLAAPRLWRLMFTGRKPREVPREWLVPLPPTA